MSDPTTLNILIIMDSRGRDIDEELIRLDLKATVIVLPGFGLLASANRAVMSMPFTCYDIIILASGICDVTARNKKHCGDRYILKKSTSVEIVDHFSNQLRMAYDLLDNHFVNARVMIATLIGVDLKDYNQPDFKFMSEQTRKDRQASKTPHPQQDILNSSIYAINHLIIERNIKNHLPSPWTSSIIHKWYGGKHHNAYNILSDGCHFTPKIRKAWAKKIFVALKKL